MTAFSYSQEPRLRALEDRQMVVATASRIAHATGVINFPGMINRLEAMLEDYLDWQRDHTRVTGNIDLRHFNPKRNP